MRGHTVGLERPPDTGGKIRVAQLAQGDVERQGELRHTLLAPGLHLFTNVLQSPVTQRDDEAAAFGHFDKHVGFHLTDFCMLPTHQCFTSAQARLGVAANLRLVDQTDFLAFQCQPEITLQIGLIRCPHVGVVVTKRNTKTLGAVHGRVGTLQKADHIFGIARIGRTSDTGTDAQLAPHDDHGLLKRLLQLDGYDFHLLGLRDSVEHRYKFVAPDPSQQVCGWQRVAQRRSHVLKNHIAHLMAQVIVDGFESVQINEQQGKRVRIRCRMRKKLLQVFHHLAAIGQTGQGIGIGQLL